MKFHEPDWIGQDVRCGNCAVKFTLEAEDEKLITCNGCDDETAEFQMKCPKCSQDIDFEVHLKKKEPPRKHEINPIKNEVHQITPQIMPAPLPRTEIEPVEEEVDVRAIRRRLLNNNS